MLLTLLTIMLTASSVGGSIVLKKDLGSSILL